MSGTAFDPDRSWKPLEARIQREKDPRRRQLLSQVRDHMETEIGGKLDDLMATLVDDPQYHLWGVGPEVGPKGRAAVEKFYADMIAAGGNRFEFDIQRIVVDEHAVVTEGAMRSMLPGAALLAAGVGEVDGEPVDAEARYLNEIQIITVWPAAADGRLVGEDIYFGSPPLSRVTRLNEPS